MKPLYAMTGLVIAGVCLVSLSFAWRSIVGQRGTWTKAQAENHARLSKSLHERSCQQADGPADAHKTHGHGDSQSDEPSTEELKASYEQSRAELERAQNRGATTALVLRWLGAVCTVVGGAGYLVLRNKD